MNRLLPLLLPVVLFAAVSCSEFSRKKLKLMKVTELSSAKISDSAIAKVLKNHAGITVDISYDLSEDTALSMLSQKKVDMAILPNNTVVEDHMEVQTVMPLLPRILLILTNNIYSTELMDLRELFENHVLVFEDMSRLDSIFFDKLYYSYGIDKSKIKGISSHLMDPDQWLDSSFVFVGLTHLHNPVMRKLLDHNARFFPLDDVKLLGKGSSVEGLNLDFPYLKPFILPKSFYKEKPLRPVLTIAIPDILVTRKDINVTTVYDVVKTLTENKTHLIRQDNIYNLLDTDFGDQQFSFPLHAGTIKFLNRDKPSIWTRYAAIIWPFVSMLAIFAGALASIQQRMRQRKKLRIESFYVRLLKLRQESFTISSAKEREKLLGEIQNLRSEAFMALMQDKLIANESFSIFLTLYNEILKEVEGNKVPD